MISPEKSRVLVVEDDRDIANLLVFHLEAEGFEVLVNPTGEKFLEQVREFRPDVVVLDLMLPAADGTELMRTLRRDPAFVGLPVIMLTARVAEADRVRGLELGADDYVVKPFSARELVARVRARLRSQPQPRTQTLRAGNLEVDLRSRTASVGGQKLELSDTEFRMLAFLMMSPGTVFSRRDIVNAVWSPQHFITERTIDVYMLRLRTKIEADPANPKMLVSVRRVGYRFEGAVEQPA